VIKRKRAMAGKKNRVKSIVQAVLLLSGVILIISGIIQGDYHDTLVKAIKICLECIGIG